MATALRSRLSYHRRLFLLLLAFSWVLVACFIVFQYGRERSTSRPNASTPGCNSSTCGLLDALDEGVEPGSLHRCP